MAASQANKSNLLEQIQAAKRSIESLKGQIETIRAQKAAESLSSACRKKSDAFAPALNPIRSRRVLRGHFGKVYSSYWSGDSVHLVSASQDGKLIVWNGVSANKVQSIPLTSSWVITCAYEQSANRLVASGGMDNICTVYRVDKGSGNAVRVVQELVGHMGYLSSAHFASERVMLTASGDSTCSCWDIERGKPTSTFKEHKADVMSISASALDSNIFASGSVDATCKIWDIRTGRSILTFRGHTGDVNCVTFFPDGHAIGTGSDDTSCRVFDMRCASELGVFGTPQILSGITSVSFSHSGRFLFAGYEDNNIRGWDMTADPGKGCCVNLGGHEGRVSSVAVNPAGDALLTGSWDTFLRVWA